MEQITISGLQLPRTRSLVVGGEMDEKEVRMASGRLVKEVIGFRKKLSAEWSWLPAETMSTLHSLLRRGGFFMVEYPDLTGDAAGLFSITIPESGVFKFVDGAPRWKDVALTFTAQEVEVCS